jgi:CheY-like chemotaxis protein
MFENPFIILEKTINVLIVDDVPEISSFIANLLEVFSVYRVQIAERAADAAQMIESGTQRFHVCLCDRGINDVERNEFFLLEKYGKSIPFIMMTAREFSDETFEYGKKGARAYVRKGTPVFTREIVFSLNDNALLGLLKARYFEEESGFLHRSIAAMKTNKPPLVGDWARNLGMLESRFCKEWKKETGANPKYALCLFHIFSELFVRINDACTNEDTLRRFDQKKCGGSLLGLPLYRRYLKYFLLNRQTINSYLYQVQPIQQPPPTT